MSKKWTAIFLILVLSAIGALAEGQKEADKLGDKPVTIVMRTQEHGQAATTEQEIVKVFMQKNPSIKVELIQGQWTQHYAQLALAVSAGEAPQLASTLLQKIVEMDQYYTPLDKSPVGNLIKESGLKESDFDKVAWRESSSKGSMYAIPNVFPGKMMWYNKDVFRKAGLDPEQFPDDMASFTDAANRIKATGAYAFFPASSGEPRFWRRAWEVALWGQGGEMFDEGYSKATFNDEKGLKALQFIVDIVQKYGWNVVGADGYKQFAARELGMIHAGAWFYPNAKSSGADWGGARMPVWFDKRMTWINGNGMVIPKQKEGTSKAVYLAALKMAWFYTENGYLSTMGAGHVCAYLPAQRNPDLLASEFWQKAGKHMAAMMSEGAVHFPVKHVRGSELESAIETKIDLAVGGKITPQEALARAESECNAILKK